MNLADEIRSLSVRPGDLAVCWLGQAGFLLKDTAGNLLAIDPYLTNCGERIRGFKRLSPMLLPPEEFMPRYQIITHLHFDHFDYDAIPIIARHSPQTLFLGTWQLHGGAPKAGNPAGVLLPAGPERRLPG
jgi:L-ascorbate 6-phosphate lactonase